MSEALVSGPNARIMRNSVVPMSAASPGFLWMRDEAKNPDIARKKVPAVSRNIPTRVLTPLASFVAPRSAGDPNWPKMNFNVNPPSIAPSTWKEMYGTNISRVVFPATVWASDIAGLMCAPEILPSRRMTRATVAPNANAMMSSASKGVMVCARDSAAIVPGPTRTRRYVPRSSERQRFLWLA